MKYLILVIPFSLLFSSFSVLNIVNTNNLFYISELFSTKSFTYHSLPDSSEPGDSSVPVPQVSNGLTDVANMYNERGFYKTNDFSLDEQEIINDFNGNLMYQIPLYNYKLAGDLNFNLSLNYNGSVGHQFFVGDVYTYTIGEAERFNMNSPEWILSLNGIAVQTLNFETSFFSNKLNANQIKGDSIHSLIPGYHFDGSLTPASGALRNRISILAGDGSVISLVNTSQNSYVGDYVYEGKELFYKAKVSYTEPGVDGYRKRLVKLVKGDGTIFIFREYKRNYYDFDTTANWNVRTNPMTLLLDEIKDNFGHYIKLWYATSHQSNDYFNKGRPFLDSITANGYSPNNIRIALTPSVTTLRLRHQTVEDGDFHFYFPRTTLTHSQSGNQKAYIERINNPLSQDANIFYENYTRTFSNITASQINSGEAFAVIFNKEKRIENYRNFLNGRRDYDYKIQTNQTTNLSVSNIGLVNNRLRSIEPYYLGNGRDAFYTNMVGSKLDSNNLKPKSLTTFYYEYTDNNPGSDKIDSLDHYATTKSIQSQDPSTINNSKNYVSVFRQYRIYPIYNAVNFYLDAPDVQGSTKLINDSSYYPNVYFPEVTLIDRNNYYYEIGDVHLNDTTFDGSFLILRNENIKNNLTRLWSYNYKYQDGSFDKPITSKFQTDPLLNKDTINYINLYRENIIHKRMSNFISGLISDTTNYYEIGLPVEEKRYDENSNLLTRKSYEYITTETDNNGYYGQLKNQKIFDNYNADDDITTEFEYYKNDLGGNSIYTGDFYPYKEGNIKLIKTPNGQETKYFYTPISASEVIQSSGQNPKLKFLIKYNDNSISESSEDIWDARLPIRIDNYKNNGTSRDTLSKIYKSYSNNGNPTKLISQNKFLTEIKYELQHRINSIILPGDFTSNSSTSTIKYNYNNSLNTVNKLSYRNTVTNNYSKIKYSLDGFGNLKEIDVFTSNTDSNRFIYQFDFMNRSARNFDALNDSIMFSYDGLGRTVKTKNADTSTTYSEYSYQNSLSGYFNTTYSGFVEKQYFTDEETNHFEKYFDAVGNLLQEIKYESEIPSDAQTVIMVTNYKYDSLYRLTKVQTPEGKIINYSYDGYGRQSLRVTTDAGQTDFVYDKNNNLIYSQDANQKVESNEDLKYTFMNYDGLNRMTGTGEAFFKIDSPFDGIQYAPNSSRDYLGINVYDTLSSAIVNFFTLPPNYPSASFSKGNLLASAYRTRFNDLWSFKYFSYDERGRLVKLWNIINGFDTLITEYSYNSQDQITDIIYIGRNQNDKKTYQYDYDYPGRLSEVNYFYIPSGNPQGSYLNFTSYIYNANSLVEEQRYKDSQWKNTYFYNNRSWISYMNSSNGSFDFTNDYFRNGNVKYQNLTGSYKDNFSRNDELTFLYSYDNSNRLKKSSFPDQTTEDYSVINSYDKDGNITTLTRFGSDKNLLDDFAYTYFSGTNKLQSLTGAGNQFSYDYNGNMIQDYLNNNTEMKYDNRNLLTELKHRSQILGDTLFLTKYFYDNAGNRIRKMTYKYLGPVQDEPSIESDVSNTSLWILRNDDVYSRGADGKEMAIYKNEIFDEWLVWGNDMAGKMDEDHLYFYQKDHLGNVRAIVNENNEVVSAQDYDPWGYLLEARTYESDESNFKFTSKERDEESFYDYFGARYYDSRIGRWGQTEPLLEKYISMSPYCYAINNSMKLIDANGLDLYIGGNQTQALNDLRSLFSDVAIQNRITSVDGLVSFDASGLDVSSDAALELINNLVSSENNYLYEVSDVTQGFFRNGAVFDFDLNIEKGYVNLSTTERNIDNGTGHEDLIPKDGYSGQVTLGTGYWTIPVSGSKIKEDRWNMVFHELSENYYRTDKKQPYKRSDQSGAHSKAMQDAKRFNRNTSVRPGWFDRYIIR